MRSELIVKILSGRKVLGTSSQENMGMTQVSAVDFHVISKYICCRQVAVSHVLCLIPMLLSGYTACTPFVSLTWKGVDIE